MNKIANLFDLQAKITLDTKDYEQSLKNAEKGMEDAGKKVGRFGDIVKGVLAADAIKAGARALVNFGKQIVDAYAEYQQLVGGVETLFGKSADTVQEYAKNAYKTAGMSANEYMKTATGFAASLLQSLGGDTEKAAQYADKAVVQMADNANKMGTDIESIKTAYQGFAKQNYTMLDNLNTMGALAA